MSLFKPTELHQFLDTLGVRAKKSLSQNFLVDGNILRKIIQEAQVSSEDLIIEIGPGPGALTQILLETGACVIAIEKDQLFAQHLPRLDVQNHLEVHEADFLQFPLVETLKNRLKPGQKAKVVANLPYQLTTPILNCLVPLFELISTITIMVQEEVACRMTAEANTEDYSSLSLFLQFYSSPRYGFFVSRSCFYPIPKVDSAIVTLSLKKPPLESDRHEFLLLMRTAFQHRRKMLKASLKALYNPDAITEALEKIGENPKARPENLSLDAFLKLFQSLNNPLTCS